MKRSHNLPTVRSLRGLDIGERAFLVVDPGKRTGLARVSFIPDDAPFTVWTEPLDDLPRTLMELAPRMAFVVCEDFLLRGGMLAQQQAGSDMPSSLGIGICWAITEALDTNLYLASPGSKSAGHLSMGPQAAAAYSRCRNDHERDVVDLASYVVRTMTETP